MADDVAVLLEDRILAALREVGTKGADRYHVIKRVALEARCEVKDAFDAFSRLNSRRPHVIRERYHGPKKGSLFYLAELKPPSRDELIRCYLDQRFKAPKGQCHACKAPLPKYRSRWCSDECSHLYLGLVRPSEGRVYAYKKSQTCALCEAPLFVRVMPFALGIEGHVTTETRSPVMGEAPTVRIHPRPKGFDPVICDGSLRWVQRKPEGARDAELDHIVPLIEGGDHDWHNLRLLCRPCHVDETAKLASRLAAKRAEQRKRELGRPSLPSVEGP